MFNITLRPDRQPRQLNLGGAGGTGGKGTEYLLIGALAVVIIGSLVLTFYGTGNNKNRGRDHKPMFKCSVAECGHEFEFDFRTMSPEDMDPEMGPMGPMGMGVMHPDCPKCGEKKSGDPMVRCPNPKCEKYYVSDSLPWGEMNDGRGARPDGPPPPDRSFPPASPRYVRRRAEHWRNLRR